MKPDLFMNDLSWYLYQSWQNGTDKMLAYGGGDRGSPLWSAVDCVYMDDNDDINVTRCLIVNVIDNYGDGFCCANGNGYINVSNSYYISNNDSNVISDTNYNNKEYQIPGYVYSTQFMENGVGDVSANASYVFEDGEWIEYCKWGNGFNAEHGCNLNDTYGLSIDIVFVFDSSFAMINDFWIEKIFAKYILTDNVPSDTRVAVITYANSAQINLNLTLNSYQVRRQIDQIRQIYGSQLTSLVYCI